MNKHTSQIWAAALLGVAGVVGLVGLELAAPGESEKVLVILVGFLSPVVVAIMGRQYTDKRLNGELDERIEQAISRALDKWTGPPPA